MHVWRRGTRFTFQQRVPTRFARSLGSTPFRISLGAIPLAEAKRRAKVLAGAVTTWVENGMTRKEITNGLKSIASSLEATASEQASFARSSSLMRLNLLLAQHQETEARASGQPFDTVRLETANIVLGLLDAKEQSYVSRQNDLKAALSSIETDSELWDRERQTLHGVIKSISNTGVVSGATAEQDTPTSEEDQRSFRPSTLLSVAGRAVLDARKAAIAPGDEDDNRYQERLENSFAAFLEVVGDKPLSFYLPIHMQDFATVLSRVPANRSKFRLFDGLTLKEMGAKNAGLSKGLQKPCLAETTIGSYLSEVKGIWRKATAGVSGVRDIGDYQITVPKGTRKAIDRDPLPVKSLNAWIADAADTRHMRKPHKAWLPIVALLTGMRLAEIVYLQTSDLVDEEGNDVFDLRRPLMIAGKEVDRPTKTKTSKRIVAIHPLLRECGFVDYVRSVKSRDGFVFSRFHEARDPADAAGKQMAEWMAHLGIHERQRQVFHSLRHNAKDWFRRHAGERLADKQCGHALNGVSANYGAKRLEPDEVQLIMSIQAPPNVDLSPLKNLRFSLPKVR